MAQPIYSTWPEAAYALGLTKATTWPAQRSVVELFCAHAFAQGVVAGEVHCSERDLASHLHGSQRSSTAARRLLRALVDRHVLRLVDGGGEGTAPSIFQPWHWSRWEVPWVVPAERAFDRIGFFAVLNVSAQPGSSAPIYMSALTRSARTFSQDISDLARSPIDERASSPIVLRDPQVQTSRCARYSARGGPSHLLTKESFALSLEGGSEQSQRTTELVSAVRDSCGVKWLARGFVFRLAQLAAESNGQFPEVAARAADPNGPRTIAERISWLEEIPAGVDPCFSRKSDERRQLESTLAALELAGEGESEDANDARQRLANLEA